MPIPLGILAVAGAGAGGLVTSYDLLETTVLSSEANTVTFTGLGSYTAYKHLQIRAAVRAADATLNSITDMEVTFNSDTSASYARHRLRGDGSSVTSAAQSSSTLIEFSNVIPAGGTTANAYGALVMDILDFSNTSKNTTVRLLNGCTVSGLQNVLLQSALYNKTDAITSITFDAPRNYVSGSRFSLYGIK